jgi:hypothetical protein
MLITAAQGNLWLASFILDLYSDGHNEENILQHLWKNLGKIVRNITDKATIYLCFQGIWKILRV